MENIFVVAGIISVIFFIVKFLEMRFVEKESKPLILGDIYRQDKFSSVFM